MPKKKQQKKTAFSFFLDEAVERLRKQGKNIKAKHEAVPYVHEQWKTMTDQEKAPYEKRVRDVQVKNNGSCRPGRLDCTGHRIDDRIDMDKVLVDERKQQKKYLSQNWQRMRREEVLEDKFYIMSFQSYFEFPEEEGYQPCELAVVEYSMKNGVSREFHAMINPGPITRGLGAEAKIYSDKYHKIPTTGFNLGRQDHLPLWNELLNFVNPEQKAELPPLFSKLTEHRKNVACLEYLAGLVRRSNRLSKVFMWEHLVLALYDYAGVTAPSLNIIEDGGNSSMYDFEPNTKCDYHETLECVHCSMLSVKKCCFWISDAFTNILKYDITENHLPVRQKPQYSVISAEDIVFNPNMKRRFIGADAMPAYDPNLPIGLQRESLRELVAGESSVDEDAVYQSRDIRYRKKFPKQSGGGRGTVFGSFRSAVSRSCHETQSIAETIDDVASAILEDDEVNSCVMADDEGSVNLRARATDRPFSVTMEKLPCGLSGATSPNLLSLPKQFDRIGLNNSTETKPNSSPSNSLGLGMRDEYVSDSSSTADDVTHIESQASKGLEHAFKRQSLLSKNLATGDAAGLTSGAESTIANDKGKCFARSKVGGLSLAQKPVILTSPLCLGRGRLLQKTPPIDSSSTYQSDSD